MDEEIKKLLVSINDKLLIIIGILSFLVGLLMFR
jgi:hypothetical protein